MSCAKKAEPIEMVFGLWTRVGQRKHELHGGAHWRHLANTTELSVCDGDAALSNYSDHLLPFLPLAHPDSHKTANVDA